MEYFLNDISGIYDRLSSLEKEFKLPHPIYVTQPAMPDLGEYITYLKDIWETKWLTNMGKYHIEFEKKLIEYMGIKHCNLFCNGTLALVVALQALRLNGEVITTPFTFAATPHVLHWNGITPIFCDIEDKTFNIDPNKIESLITPKTVAILPVHVYGYPCDVDAIKDIADRHGLRIIYDAAHAFGVKMDGQSLVQFGDITMLSFHAAKLFTTFEGGALIVHDDNIKKRIDSLKNFGIADEETVIAPGINGKMNELQAAFGILELEIVGAEISKRRKLANMYRNGLKDIPGVSYLPDKSNVEHNYSYFPILIDRSQFGISRDELHGILKKFNIITRKYFHPLCSHYPCYKSHTSADPKNLPVAEDIVKKILCLPIYGNLPEENVDTICQILKELYSLRKVLVKNGKNRQEKGLFEFHSG